MLYSEVVLFFLTLAVAFHYAYLISSVYDGWENMLETRVRRPIRHYYHFTIVIPARNEGKNITPCLQSVQALNYPSSHYKVIVADDHSEDNTKELAALMDYVTVLDNKGKGKKDALMTGIHAAHTEFIVTLDADCTIHPDLLLLYNDKLNENPSLHCITGGVLFEEEKSVTGWFQSLEVLSLMAVTVHGIRSGSFYLANGANMCFRKETFFEVEGYASHHNLASGDDVFLINEIVKKFQPRAVSFLKSRRGAVRTKPAVSIGELKLQRYRWASKTKNYANAALLYIQGTVFATHVYALLLLLLCIFYPLILWFLIHLLLIKAIIDYLFLRRMAYFYEVKWSISGFISTTLFYYPYILFTAYAAMAKGKYVWKGRVTR